MVTADAAPDEKDRARGRSHRAVSLSTAAFDGPGEAQGRTYRVGVLLFSTPTTDPNVPVFREALRATGYVEGRNLVLEFRYADGQARAPEGRSRRSWRSSGPISSMPLEAMWCPLPKRPPAPSPSWA